jgi:8-oxo-dGTP pyrophosphatase MutT (NUDIX family)
LTDHDRAAFPAPQRDLVTEPWVQLSTKRVYENAWIKVDEDIVRVPNGHETIYGVVRMTDAIGILPFVDNTHVLLVQQYRYVAGDVKWEMPTGGRHADESIEETAQRELAEEAGFHAASLEHLVTFHTSKSVVDEAAYLFVARDLSPATATPDATELFRRQVWLFSEVVDMVVRGTITDSMTMMAVLLADRMGLGR